MHKLNCYCCFRPCKIFWSWWSSNRSIKRTWWWRCLGSIKTI